MVEAQEFHQISNTVFVWTAYDPACKCDLYSTGVITPAGMVMVDPIGLAEPVLNELIALAPPRLILLTNGNHARHADTLRKQLRIPVATSVFTKKELTEFRPEIVVVGNELLYGISLHSVEGGPAGESAYLTPEGVLILGDSLINLDPEHGAQLLPDKYCKDVAQMRASLEKLLVLDFSIITLAHGMPIVSNARETLAALVRT